ncbi:hypothetical protein [Neobacillus kokaensis]|uniref:Uncharacterized protein n=1 Tax=Neobacillus kokaensis TaxID=2759023 RepID=A0ABQ3N810_9BACI|nr:hypothetical protein [Neobacillus kokaensis]GHI00124.1 hypothetical protein AM1BK_36660 [Neobacillus kokaensis]
MTGVVIFLIGIGIIAAIVSSAKKRKKLLKENIPGNLGVIEHVPLQPLLEKLDKSLDVEYIHQVKRRFLKDHPNRSEDEFEWLLFELKRYFVMANILKKAPMFSEDVDEIWHEMILFTKEYQGFSEKFLGKMLHHIPNTSPEPAPQERAFFDWVFSQMFEITQFSWKTWGSFFKHPMAGTVLKDFRNHTEDELIEKYFQANEDNRELLEYLAGRMKQQLVVSEKIYQANPKGSFSKQRTYGDMTALSLMMVFFSYYYFGQYWDYAKVYAFAEITKYTSGCSNASFCGSSSSDDSGDNGGGGDSSCSSCSSCGGGCSS